MTKNISKKRKRSHQSGPAENDVDTTKPTAVFTPTGGRSYTVSIAVPGSIISNAQGGDLKTHIAGRIARALAVFCVDEVIVFDDGQGPELYNRGGIDEGQFTGDLLPDTFLARILSYLETPPNFRTRLFSMHPDLEMAGKLPSLDMPHHLRPDEWCPFREGITHTPDRRPGEHPDARTLVDTGLKNPVSIPVDLPPNTRVTVRFSSQDMPKDKSKTMEAEVVTPSAPREEAGYYWGYAVRPASSLSAVITECPFDGGYDLTFGTSERGRALHEALLRPEGERDPRFGGFEHLLIVFGGVAGLEVAVTADSELADMQVTKPEALFDYWVNLCPGQGSRTIRTEEAVWMGLMGLSDIIRHRGNSPS